MRHYKLTAAQSAANNGYTDLFVVPWDDTTLVAGTVDDTAVSVVLDGLVAGDLVYQNACLEIHTAFAGTSMTCTASVGVVGDTTAITPALTLITTGTAVAAPDLVVSANQTDATYEATTGINLVCEFTPSNTTCTNDMTAGAVWAWLNISRRAERSQYLQG